MSKCFIFAKALMQKCTLWNVTKAGICGTGIYRWCHGGLECPGHRKPSEKPLTCFHRRNKLFSCIHKSNSNTNHWELCWPWTNTFRVHTLQYYINKNKIWMSYFDCNGLLTCKQYLWRMCLTYLILLRFLDKASLYFLFPNSAPHELLDAVFSFFPRCLLKLQNSICDLLRRFEVQYIIVQVYREWSNIKQMFMLESSALKKPKIVKNTCTCTNIILLHICKHQNTL